MSRTARGRWLEQGGDEGAPSRNLRQRKNALGGAALLVVLVSASLFFVAATAAKGHHPAAPLYCSMTGLSTLLGLILVGVTKP